MCFRFKSTDHWLPPRSLGESSSEDSAREFTEISSSIQKAGAKLLGIAFLQAAVSTSIISKKKGDLCD